MRLSRTSKPARQTLFVRSVFGQHRYPGALKLTRGTLDFALRGFHFPGAYDGIKFRVGVSLETVREAAMEFRVIWEYRH